MQLFSRGVDTVFRTIIGGAAAAIVGVPLLLMWWVRTPYVTGQFDPLTQPVAFDHRHHVVDDGIDCLYCHTDAERSPYAGVPSTETCMNCHDQIWNRSPLLNVVWRSHADGAPIAWQRVNMLPDFVYFNHGIHVSKGVGCETCHGRIDRMARIYQAAPLTMGWCLDCHRHPEQYLRPRSEVTTMGYTPIGRQADVGRRLMAAYNVRSRTYCTACHR